MKTKTCITRSEKCAQAYSEHLTEALLELHNVDTLISEAIHNEEEALQNLIKEIAKKESLLKDLQTDLVENTIRIDKINEMIS